MTEPEGHSAERAADRVNLLLRWYPASWRERYGEEFAELLLAELAEQPRAWRRTANVARCGLVARLVSAGLAGHCGHPAGPAAAVRACLGTLTCSLAIFLTFGTTMWAQLAVGWQWAPPASPALTSRAANPQRATFAVRRHARGCSVSSASNSSANSSP